MTSPPRAKPESAKDTVADSAAVGEIADRVAQITRENQALFMRLIEGERRYRGLAKAVWMVQEDERRRLARELHDGIGQTLTALKNQLDRLRQRVDDPVLSERLADSVELAGTALDDTRELSRLLRPAVLDDLGLEAALAWLSRTLGQRTGLTIEVNCDLGEQRFEPDLETVVFRIVQESLTNIVKHAGVDRASVEVETGQGMLRLRVIDAGCGFDAGAALAGGEVRGLGLRGMRDRVELFGGKLDIDSRNGAGCVVEVVVPMLPARDDANGVRP